ncbi:hypothetical protein ACLOJK_005270 [Asimina triloba]
METGEAYLKAEDGKKIGGFLTPGLMPKPQKQVVVVVVDVGVDGACSISQTLTRSSVGNKRETTVVGDRRTVSSNRDDVIGVVEPARRRLTRKEIGETNKLLEAAEQRFDLSLPASSSSVVETRIRPRMAALHHSQAERDAGPQIHTIHMPGGEPVEIVPAPGLSDSDFSPDIINLFSSHLRQQGLDMFGRRVGFLKFKADVIDKVSGKKVPGIVFARGPAVAVLILLESGPETFVVLTEQVRVPVGRYVLELPAGMLDDDKGDVLGTAVREVEEETGICLNVDDMVNLTALLDPSTGFKVIPSPGGCDEELSLFLYRGHADPEVIKALQGKETGLREHGELIKVHAVPYDRLWRMTPDAKVLCAIAIYEMAKREGLLSLGNAANPSS